MHNLFYVPPEKVSGKEIIIDGEEFHHIKHVLRKRVDATVFFTDGEGNKYTTKITHLTKSEMVAHITARIFEEYVRRVRYALAFVPVKGTRNDYVLEKGTELGIAQFFPFVSRYSVIPRLCSSRTKRFRKIAVSAMLQSQQYYLPKIDVFGNVEALTEVFTQFDRVFVAEQKGDKNINEHGSSVLLVVGPEGGFDKEEIGLFERGGVRLLSLGQQRLRSETAAIVGVTKIMSAYGEL